MKRVAGILASLAFIALPALALWQRQEIADWLVLRSYIPPSRVQELANHTSMTDYGRRLLYVHKPSLDSKDDFNAHCTVNETTIVLGCYISGQGIYIYDVTDSRLSGIHEVTAAHEMLHAAYDRLNDKERKRIDQLLNEAYASLKDERLQNLIKTYEERDPGIVANELHSILATEVSELPSELESYYQKYFDDRQMIVQYAKRYEGAFQDLEKQVKLIDAQLSSLKIEVESMENALTSQADHLAAERRALDAELAANDYESYNKGVNSYNQQVQKYNGLLAQYKTKVSEYNSVVEKRNSIAGQQQELIQAIDSRIGTIEKEE